ncbi:hypothetical protein P9112_003679 [Eukaryota sp. TZLM1-RC]
MSLLDLVAGGAFLHSHNQNCVALHDKYFAYASCLSIYIYDITTFKLLSIISRHEKHITAIAFRPSLPLTLAVISVDSTLRIYKPLETETTNEISSMVLSDIPISLTFDPSSPSLLYVLCRSSRAKLYIYHIDRCSAEAVSLKDAGPAFPSILKHSPVLDLLAIGNDKFRVYSTVNSAKMKLMGVISPPKSSLVKDIQFDPFSDNFCLVAFDNCIIMVDLATVSTIRAFDYGNIGSIAFDYVNIGRFCASRGTDLLNFHVSKDNFENLNILGTEQIHCLVSQVNIGRLKGQKAPESSRNHLIGGVFSSGNFFIYSLRSDSIVYTSKSGHSETVFSLKFSPNTSEISYFTSSFDGTIRSFDYQYDCHNAVKFPISSCSRIFPKDNCTIFCIDFCPFYSENFKILASGNSQGVLSVWNVPTDTKRSVNILFKLELNSILEFSDFEESTYPIIRITWLDPQTLLVGSRSGKALILQISNIERAIETQKPCLLVKHLVVNLGSAVNGVNFKQIGNFEYLICCGVENGSVSVHRFNLQKFQISDFCTLKGHVDSVFEVVFVPNSEILVSGSFDKTIRVWDFKKRSCLTILRGHSGPVRPVLVHPIFNNILISGSWDSTIKIWNIDQNKCILTLHHVSDVYGLDIHPNFPHLLASSSRDQTIKIWNLSKILPGASEFFTLSILSVDSKFPKITRKILDNSFYRPVNISPKFKISDPFMSSFSQIFDQFHPSTEHFVDVLCKLRDISCDITVQKSLLIIHQSKLNQTVNHIAGQALSDLSKPRTLSSSPRKCLLEKAAIWCLLSGKYSEYCDLMAKEGLWEVAFMIAPLAGPDVWSRLVKQRFSEVLTLESCVNSTNVAFSLAAGNLKELTTSFTKHGQYREALALGQSILAQSDHCNQSNGFGIRSHHQSESLSNLIMSTIHSQAEYFMDNSDAISSATVYLSVNLFTEAVNVLLNTGHTDLAFLLVVLFTRNVPEVVVDEVVYRYCLRLTRLGHGLLAVQVAQKWMKNQSNLIVLLLTVNRCSNCPNISDGVPTVISSLSLKSTDPFSDLIKVIIVEKSSEVNEILSQEIEKLISNFDKYQAQLLLKISSTVNFSMFSSATRSKILGNLFHLAALVCYFKDGKSSLTDTFLDWSLKFGSKNTFSPPKTKNFTVLPPISGSQISVKSQKAKWNFKSFFHITSVFNVADGFDLANATGFEFDMESYKCNSLFIPY